MRDMDKENVPENGGDEIDLMAIIKKFKDHKGFIIKVCIIGFIVGIVVAFSIPKEYTTTVILAQSTSSDKGAGGLGALASMAGIDLQQSSGGELSPALYPDILSSTPFLLGLFDIQVKDPKNEIETSLDDYLIGYQKSAWWNYILGLPSMLFSSSNEPETNITQQGDDQTNDSKIITLTRRQEAILGNLQSRINIAIDKKTGALTLDVTMQNPVVSAVIADTIISYMQSYIINYRTEKARQNLEYIEKLHIESKDNYFKAQQAHAKFTDENLFVVSAKYQTNLIQLQQEMNLTFNIYNQAAQQLQLAKIKVEDTKPICIIIQPAVVPSLPSKPRKKIILAGFLFMAFAGACGWVYLKDMIRGKEEDDDEENVSS